jgi:vacuolar-type H+-ATPase subunit I/STV1
MAGVANEDSPRASERNAAEIKIKTAITKETKEIKNINRITKSLKFQIYPSSKQKLTTQEYIEEEERKIKEMIFLRQFNSNFDKYKDEINTKLYERDKEELEMLNEIGQPKIFYRKKKFFAIEYKT